jgi:hypothetical protein
MNPTLATPSTAHLFQKLPKIVGSKSLILRDKSSFLFTPLVLFFGASILG